MIFRFISAVLLSLLVGFASGYWKGGNDNQLQADADKKTALERLIKQTALLDAENDEITQDWLDQNSEVKTITEYVEREVIKYVPDAQKQASACNITVGTECLLNARRLNILPADECGEITADRGRTASPVTEAGLISADIECADKYAKLRNKHKSLAAIVINYQKRIAGMRRGDDG